MIIINNNNIKAEPKDDTIMKIVNQKKIIITPRI